VTTFYVLCDIVELKNIIILQSLEDANHRTAITATKIFLDSNGYITKEVKAECYLSFKKDLFIYLQV
jgi:prophage maintenance system killer protein